MSTRSNASHVIDNLASRAPVPQPYPAYLSTSDAPLTASQEFCTIIFSASRTPHFTHKIPRRSGLAIRIPARSIFRISTPSGPQVADLNIWNLHNPRERFWAARTRQLHASHVSVGDRLWSCLPYMRPLATIVRDSLSWYGVDEHGGRVHDLLGTRCDPYINHLLSNSTKDNQDAAAVFCADYDFHCHSNLVRAV